MLHTPVTWAPNAFAICTANDPTAPPAPMISTFCPGCTSPLSRSAWRAAKQEVGTVAACSKVRFAGLGAILSVPSGGVLGEGAGGDAEHLIARLEPRDILADLLDATRRIDAPDPGLGPAEPEAQDAEQVRQTRHDVPVADVCTRRVNAEQHVAAADHRFVDICEL